MSWYNDMPKDVTEAARALAGNWGGFASFHWSDKPEHRPEDCALIYLSNRDSDCVDKSNEASIVEALAPCTGWMPDGAMVETCSHNHWAVGYVDGIVIRCVDEHGEPTWAFRKLHALALRLANYPVLDDDDLSTREHEAANETWKGCYNDSERLGFVRTYRDEFNFQSFADLLGCVRGKFYAGEVCRMLHY